MTWIRVPENDMPTDGEYTARFEDRWLHSDRSTTVYADALVKWDGCVEFTTYSQGGRGSDSSESQRLHICGIPEFIETLKEIDRLARLALYRYDAHNENPK